jgi:50S ribosomal protein L16 3-hydroxylase
MTRKVHSELKQHQPSQADTERFLLRHLSEPKATTVFDAPAKPLSPAQFRRRVSAHGLRLDRKTRMLYSNASVAINGELIQPARNAMPVLRALADQRSLSADQAQRAPSWTWAVLHAWYSAGWSLVD